VRRGRPYVLRVAVLSHDPSASNVAGACGSRIRRSAPGGPAHIPPFGSHPIRTHRTALALRRPHARATPRRPIPNKSSAIPPRHAVPVRAPHHVRVTPPVTVDRPLFDIPATRPMRPEVREYPKVPESPERYRKVPVCPDLYRFLIPPAAAQTLPPTRVTPRPPRRPRPGLK